MNDIVRGHLLPPGDAPPTGERSEDIARVGTAVVEQILSGALTAPVNYEQPHDEWVVVLHGRAILEVAGERLDLKSGDWVLLPAHVPHRLVETLQGTSWLALHGAT